MRKRIFFIAMLMMACEYGIAQNRFFTKAGAISFFSDAPMEKIEAVNNSVSCVLDKSSGTVQFLVLMKGFEFKKALMQEHFNESYVESDRYPKASFKGRISNNNTINYDKEGSYEAVVTGKLMIHGEEKDMEAKGTLTVLQGKIVLKAVFPIALSDYKISIPALVKDKVSERVQITVDATLTPLQ